MLKWRAMVLCAALLALRASATGAESEIAYLLEYIRQSGCTFYRNGGAYDAEHAAAHLRSKYDVAAASGKILTTEAFIAKIATASSMTGRPYLVECAGAARGTTADWLTAALSRHRKESQ